MLRKQSLARFVAAKLIVILDTDPCPSVYMYDYVVCL
jgi:hypothetical protein